MDQVGRNFCVSGIRVIYFHRVFKVADDVAISELLTARSQSVTVIAVLHIGLVDIDIVLLITTACMRAIVNANSLTKVRKLNFNNQTFLLF